MPKSTQSHFRSLVVSVLAASVIVSCGGYDEAKVVGIGSGGASNQTKVSAGIKNSNYLEQGLLEIKSIDATLAQASDLVVTQNSGAPMLFNVDNGNLYYLSPEEQFIDSKSELKLASLSAAKSILLTFDWTTRRGKSLTTNSEKSDDVSEETAPLELKVQGINNGYITLASLEKLSFQLLSGTTLDLTTSSIVSFTKSGDADITSLFTFNASNNQFTIAPAGIAKLTADLKSSSVVELSLSLCTSFFAQCHGYEQTVRYTPSSLNVSVKNTDGSAAIDLVGSKFVIKGLNTGYVALGAIDSTGKVSFKDLPYDGYTINQVLLKEGIPLSGFEFTTADSPTINYTIAKQVNINTSRTMISGKNSNSIMANYLYKNTSKDHQLKNLITKKNDIVPYNQYYCNDTTFNYCLNYDGRELKLEILTGPGYEYYPNGFYYYYYEYFPTNQILYSIPRGTQKIYLEVYSSTIDFYFAKPRAEGNNFWFTKVSIPDIGFQYKKIGTINDTYNSVGYFYDAKCIDVSTATKNQSISMIGSAGVTFSPFWQLYDYSVNGSFVNRHTHGYVSVKNDCFDNADLKINTFTGKATNSSGNNLFYPRKSVDNVITPDGNLSGQYFSMPISARLPTSYGFPSTIEYSPKDAKISKIELFQRTNEGDISLGSDYLSQANTSKEGEIKFANLLINPTTLQPSNSRVQIIAKLTGTINDVEKVSSTENLKIDSFDSFTPLYLTSELANYSATRRYGSRDAGGDSWGTKAMLDWLSGTTLVYDDLSAGHIAQTATNRSVLDHSGHSDGSQADLRYWNNLGTHTPPYNGQGNGALTGDILNLSTAAFTEFNNVSLAQRPSLEILISWINNNRTNLNTYASLNSTRRAYIGDGYIASLLVNGKFAGTNINIPFGSNNAGAVGVWTNRSNKIRVLDVAHRNHWHINTSLK